MNTVTRILTGIIIAGVIFLTIGFVKDCVAQRALDRDTAYQQCIKDPTCVQ